jgi:spoIIIJ-associated protein
MGLFTKIFGGNKSGNTQGQSLINDLLEGTIQKSGLDISFEIKSSKEEDRNILKVDFFGEDEKLFTSKDGALLDAFQLFMKRALQHNQPEDNTHLFFDCNGYRERANQDLLDLADKLKNRALDQGKSVYVRALPPKDRKIVHQFLAEDERVKSRSVGDGLYKKIKIYPAKKEGDRPSTH